jgi:hypothetical protein
MWLFFLLLLFCAVEPLLEAIGSLLIFTVRALLIMAIIAFIVHT